MFSQVATLFALIPMLFHGMLGCCWHHEHSSDSHHMGATSVCHSHQLRHDSRGHGHTLGHDHSHSETSEEAPAPEAPCDNHECLGASLYTNIAPESATLKFGLSIVSFVGHAGFGAVSLTSTRTCAATEAPFRPYCSSGKSRALSQVWVI